MRAAYVLNSGHDRAHMCKLTSPFNGTTLSRMHTQPRCRVLLQAPQHKGEIVIDPGTAQTSMLNIHLGSMHKLRHE